MKFAIVSMEMGLLINWLVDVISNSTNVSGHYLHQKTYVKFLNGCSLSTTFSSTNQLTLLKFLTVQNEDISRLSRD